MESFKVAKDDAYGQLPEPNSKHVYRLSDDYMAMATRHRDAAQQGWCTAGIRPESGAGAEKPVNPRA